MSEKPEQRRWKFVGKIEADEWEGLIAALRSITFDVHRRTAGEVPFVVISGGYDSNYAFTVTEKPDMTHDKYFEELDAYLEERRTPPAPAQERE